MCVWSTLPLQKDLSLNVYVFENTRVTALRYLIHVDEVEACSRLKATWHGPQLPVYVGREVGHVPLVPPALEQLVLPEQAVHASALLHVQT